YAQRSTSLLGCIEFHFQIQGVSFYLQKITFLKVAVMLEAMFETAQPFVYQLWQVVCTHPFALFGALFIACLVYKVVTFHEIVKVSCLKSSESKVSIQNLLLLRIIQMKYPKKCAA